MQVEIPLMNSMENIILVCLYKNNIQYIFYLYWVTYLTIPRQFLLLISKIVMKCYGYV